MNDQLTYISRKKASKILENIILVGNGLFDPELLSYIYQIKDIITAEQFGYHLWGVPKSDWEEIKRESAGTSRRGYKLKDLKTKYHFTPSEYEKTRKASGDELKSILADINLSEIDPEELKAAGITGDALANLIKF